MMGTPSEGQTHYLLLSTILLPKQVRHPRTLHKSQGSKQSNYRELLYTFAD